MEEMEDQVEVTLHSPVKLGLCVLIAGTHKVSPADLRDLTAAGVVASVGGEVAAGDVRQVDIETPEDLLLARLDEADRMVSIERQNVADLTEKLTAAHAEIDVLKAATAAADKPTTAIPPVAKITPKPTAAKKGAATS